MGDDMVPIPPIKCTRNNHWNGGFFPAKNHKTWGGHWWRSSLRLENFTTTSLDSVGICRSSWMSLSFTGDRFLKKFASIWNDGRFSHTTSTIVTYRMMRILMVEGCIINTSTYPRLGYFPVFFVSGHSDSGDVYITTKQSQHFWGPKSWILPPKTNVQPP